MKSNYGAADWSFSSRDIHRSQYCLLPRLGLLLPSPVLRSGVKDSLQSKEMQILEARPRTKAENWLPDFGTACTEFSGL